MKAIAILFTAGLLVSCAEKRTAPAADTREKATKLQQVDVTTSAEFAAKNPTFDKYWFRGLAELNSYELSQSRYGELHDGKAVLVFVTEPFLTDRQVKHESGPGENAEQVLKLNNYRRFNTGVYPYTMMTSTFTPARREGSSHKLTQTVTEWCGQVFAQMNLNPEQTGFDVQAFSYFQGEGDRAFALPTTLIEDDLWTRIRLGPDKLPTGTLQILPSVTYLRLLHKPWDIVEATATLGPPQKTDYSDAPVRTYTLEYPTYERTLKIFFEDAFPHRIVGWEETAPSVFQREGEPQQLLTTRAKLSASIMLDYWARHGNEGRIWRQVLNLDE